MVYLTYMTVQNVSCLLIDIPVYDSKQHVTIAVAKIPNLNKSCEL